MIEQKRLSRVDRARYHVMHQSNGAVFAKRIVESDPTLPVICEIEQIAGIQAAQTPGVGDDRGRGVGHPLGIAATDTRYDEIRGLLLRDRSSQGPFRRAVAVVDIGGARGYTNTTADARVHIENGSSALETDGVDRASIATPAAFDAPVHQIETHQRR